MLGEECGIKEGGKTAVVHVEDGLAPKTLAERSGPATGANAIGQAFVRGPEQDATLFQRLAHLRRLG